MLSRFIVVPPLEQAPTRPRKAGTRMTRLI